MIPIHVSPGRVYTRPLDGGPWVELGRADGNSFIFATMDDEYHADRDTLLCTNITGRTMTMTVKLDRSRLGRLYRALTGRRKLPRNRRRNPLHAVRAELRRHHRRRRDG